MSSCLYILFLLFNFVAPASFSVVFHIFLVNYTSDLLRKTFAVYSCHCCAQMDLISSAMLPCFESFCHLFCQMRHYLILINAVQRSYCWRFYQPINHLTATSCLQLHNMIHLGTKLLLHKQFSFLLQVVDICVFFIFAYFYKCFSPLSFGMQLIYLHTGQHWYKSTEVSLFTQHGAAENLVPDNFSSKFCTFSVLLVWL